MKSVKWCFSLLFLVLAIPSLALGFDASLSWTDDVTNEDGWRIERSVDGGANTVLATLAADAISYNDLNVPVNATLTYYVVPFNTFGDDPTPPSGTTETKPPDSSATITITVQ